ncbi:MULTISPECIES: TonB-dependent receptor [unclassified Kaistella]|uniref:TonB-dependent receptor n=1 Tax=unclassified Kaistella TaxID=2762626 RepID=UPI0027359111|nr:MULTISPECIES: TonB-dependent receptor [unclassified Kaistella]MDP2453991.1 TonB-dependent receptor [Kaistella sp. SH11-4b]MDP2457048.1 TonB-dependent receptor [Kaistella sp. SH40-3]MDP2459805.1 TonB-dependent receptor [Kaistella sp. SH19-2b]
MKFKVSFFLLVLSIFISAQSGSINVNVFDDFTKKPLPAKVTVVKNQQEFSGVGNIIISALPSGNYNLEIDSDGYETGFLNDINIVPNQNLSFSIGLNRIAKNIDEIIFTKKQYKTTAESPLSLRNITSEEVQKNAGSTRDVSKAILSFPGVGSTATFRNDLFIRGGSSAENKFYIDGIEVPVINHFQTQGASGGPRGIITIDFVKDVYFYSGAFPAGRNGALSSLFEFNLKQARKDKLGYKAVIGLDDMQLMADGPLSKDQSWTGLFSVRKSNLQLLFKAIGLPFLPSYYDATFKVSKKYQSGDELFFLGLGAKDSFKFNDDAEKTLTNLTLIDQLPVSPQWNYTIGAGYRHLAENGNWLLTASRNMLDNQALKYYRNIETPDNLLYNYKSQESENKVRFDRNFTWADYQFSAGANINFSKYYNNSTVKNVTQNAVNFDDILSEINVFQYGMYVQTASKFFDDQLQVSAGARFDASNYNEKTSNPLEQFSPRISLSYKLNPEFALNFNTGIYYQLPAYTALGFMENGNFTNENSLKYIRNSHIVGGVEYNGKNNLRLTVEGFYKKYKNYPFSLRNQISLANVGANFGVVGNEPLDSRGFGETYGIEFLAQKRTVNNFYGIMAYTFGYSKFSNAAGNLLPSSWDSRHILAITAGKYLNRNWNLGARFRMQSGLPETPYDLQRSALVNIWNIANGPLQDFSLLNSARGNLSHQLDLRAEKKWVFKKWQLTAYMDVVNAYGSKSPSNLPIVNLQRDANNNGIIANPNDSQNQQYYLLETGESDRSTPIPYFGFIFEF